ncbi:unnamed protein product [Ilex paraguariensis]|uniref:Chloroplast lumen common family protein n=1 Tax=Ilex paraguariensis TaxID=185542 RepID=A0ABC8RQI3_9AQUA
MNTMETLAKVNYRHQPLIPLLYPHSPSFCTPISSLSFRNRSPRLSSPPLKSSSSTSSIPIKSSSSTSSNSRLPNPQTPKTQLLETLNPFLFSLLKTTFIAVVTATALFFAKFNLKPAIAAPISLPPTVESTQSETVSEEENEKDREKSLREHLQSHPNDVEALRSLMEIQIKNQKVHEAISIIERLIELEPSDIEWPLLRAHMHCYGGETELAKSRFNEIIDKDPFRVEAYHGLVLAASQEDSNNEMKEIENRIEEGMKMCKKENKKDDLKDFKLLLAQIRVIEGDYKYALRIYQELVQEDPRDFRPYLCQGIIYTLLKKKDEAEKNFDKYRRLVPKGHPYARYFDDNMIATKLFAQKVENERANSKS